MECRNLFVLLYVTLAAVIVVGCGESKSARGETAPPDVVQNTCDHLITEESIQVFHAKQANFRIAPAGPPLRCRAQVNVNGAESTVMHTAYESIFVNPDLKFVSTVYDEERKTYVLKVKVVPTPSKKLRDIVNELGLRLNESQPVPVNLEFVNFPSYIRFDRGALFRIQSTKERVRERDTIVNLFVQADSLPVEVLKDRMRRHAAKKVQMQFLWMGIQKQAYFQKNQDRAAEAQWGDSPTVQILKSQLADEGVAESTKFVATFSQAIAWGFKQEQLKQELPELYQSADQVWSQPVVNPQNSGEMLQALSYLVMVNASHPRRSILETCIRLARFQTMESALEASVEFHDRGTWTQEQFELIIQRAEALLPRFGVVSWKMSQRIAEKMRFNRERMDFVVVLIEDFLKRGLVSDGAGALNPIFAKIDAGLNEKNRDMYFRVYDTIRGFKTDSHTAESTADSWVFSGKVHAGNLSLYIDLLTWLQALQNGDFEEAMKTLKSLMRNRPLDQEHVHLFKVTYDWLSGAQGISTVEALKRAALYQEVGHFNASTLNTMKDYAQWLVTEMQIERSEALVRSEYAALSQRLSGESLVRIKALALWYVTDIGLAKAEGIKRAEKMILVSRLDQSREDLLKEFMLWLVLEVGVKNSEAASMAEAYVVQYSMTMASYEQAKSLTAWYVELVGLTKIQGFNRAAEFVLQSKNNQDRVRLLQDSTLWLIEEVRLDRSRSATRAERYLNLYALSFELFSALKIEYSSLLNLGLEKMVALEAAERTILGGNLSD